MKKSLLSAVAAISLVAGFSAQAADPLALTAGKSAQHVVGMYVPIVAFAAMIPGLIYAHQVYKNGELRASAEDVTFGGEDRLAQSTATPAMSAVSTAYNPQRDEFQRQWAAIQVQRGNYAYAGQ